MQETLPPLPINYWAVLVAAILNMVWGALWYSPRFLGRPWMKLVGLNPEQIAADPARANRGYIYASAASFLLAFILAHFIRFTEATTAWQGVQTGMWSWLGFVATTHLPNYVFENRPLRLYLINIGYPAVAMASMGALLAVWR